MAQQGTAIKKELFLETYALVGSIPRAAAIADIGRRTHYNWLAEDSEYAAKFAQADLEFTDRLEAEARRRAHEGLERLKFNKGNAIIDPRTGEQYVEREYSDTLLIFLLKGAKPEKYAERAKVEVTDATLTPEERAARLAAILDAGRARRDGPAAKGKRRRTDN